jgi:putative restriction endonuclease
MFAFVRELARKAGGGPLHSADLRAFKFEGRSIPLVQQRGIVKTRSVEAALTIRTAFVPDPALRPYDDHEGLDGYPRYKWQGSNPADFDNVALRAAMKQQRPLAWFRGVAPSLYLADLPVWVVDEEMALQQFVVALDATMRDNWPPNEVLDHPIDYELRRRYATSVVRTRVHQRVFRERVLHAYEHRCALCNLRHDNLLDAAHIKEDSEGGEPVVPNGVSMCAIHHRAFDGNVIGIRPDYVIEVRNDVLEETDGPTLRFALQGVHKAPLSVPRLRAARPDVERLEERYQRFREAS